MGGGGEAVSRADLRRSYDRSAAGYEERFAALQAPKYEAVLARWRPPEGARLLDLGAGTGLLLRRLGPRTPPPVALDLSGAMLARCPATGVHRVQGDLLRLPFRPASCDGVLAITSLLLPAGQRVAALLEVARVLRPGGVLALTLLRADAPADLSADLSAVGLAATPRFECGQDVGWICVRRA